MKLFLMDKIEKIEESEEFKKLFEKVENRKNGAKKAVETKKNKLISYIENLTIKIPIIDDIKLIKKAIKHYNNNIMEKYNFVSEYDEERANKIRQNYITDNRNNLDKDFLNRIKVNYIRHQLSNYEKELEEIFGKIGKKEAYFLLKNKILDKIADIYPDLKNECKNQKIRNQNVKEFLNNTDFD